MKRTFILAICAIAAAFAVSSCQKGPEPDGAVGISSIAVTKALNPGLAADINGMIDEKDKTVTFVVPEGVTLRSAYVTFTATPNDVVKIGATTVESGVTPAAIIDGDKITVKDDVSNLSTAYTIIVKDNDGKAEVLSITIEAKNNTGLIEKDVVAAEITDKMVLRVPATAFQKELTITVTATKNDIIKINGVDVAEEKASAKVNTLFPIDITVTDEYAKTYKDYELKVGKVLATQIKLLGEYALADTKMDGAFSLAVNPKTDEPYFSYLATPTASGSKKTLYVAKWSNSAFVPVGANSGQAAATSAAATAAPINLRFTSDGTPFVMFKGAEISNLISVKSFDGTEWKVVGAIGASNKFTASFGEPQFGFNGKNPYFVYTGSDKNNKPEEYRNAVLASFNGTSWSLSPKPFSGLPVNDGVTSDAMFYRAAVANVSDNVSYIMTSCNLHGYYVYKMENGSMTNVVSDFKPEGEDYGIPTCMAMAVGPEKKVYMIGASSKGASYAIYTLDEAAKTLKMVGQPIRGTAGSSGSVAEYLAFGVNPVSGQIVAIYQDTEGLPTFSSINENGAWEEFIKFGKEVKDEGWQIVFDSKGVGYAAYSYKSNSNIALFKIDKEDDILPEK